MLLKEALETREVGIVSFKRVDRNGAVKKREQYLDDKVSYRTKKYLQKHNIDSLTLGHIQ